MNPSNKIKQKFESTNCKMPVKVYKPSNSYTYDKKWAI